MNNEYKSNVDPSNQRLHVYCQEVVRKHFDAKQAKEGANDNGDTVTK